MCFVGVLLTQTSGGVGLIRSCAVSGNQLVRPKARDCCLFCPFCPPLSSWVGHLHCEGVVERNRGNCCSGFCRMLWLAIHFENEVRKQGILQVVSNVNFHLVASSKNHANLAEIGVRKRSVRMRKFKWREWKGDNCVN